MSASAFGALVRERKTTWLMSLLSALSGTPIVRGPADACTVPTGIRATAFSTRTALPVASGVSLSSGRIMASLRSVLPALASRASMAGVRLATGRTSDPAP
jgi:hypothetical protein